MTKANDLTGWFLLAIIVLSPIPLGNNPPVFWAIAGTLVGTAAAAYLAFAARSREGLRVPFRPLRPFIVPGAVLCLWLLIQTVPLGSFMGPFVFSGAAGQVVASETLSLAPGSTWMMLVRMLTYGLIFFLAAQVGANDKRARWMLVVVFWAIVVHAAFGLFQLTQLNDTILGFEKKHYLGVATGTFINRNSYATFLAMGLTIGAALVARNVISERARNERIGDLIYSVMVLIGGMFVIVIALLATQSRMGFFAGVIGVVLVALLTSRWLPRARLVFPLLLIALSAVAVGLAWYFGQGLLERVISLAGSSADREAIYRQVLDMILERPWLGYGGGAFELAFPLFYGPPLSPEILIDKAHSTYLTLVAELGIVAGLIPIGIVAWLFGRNAVGFWHDPDGAALRLAAMGVIAVGAIHSLVDFSLEMQANAILLVALLGIGFASGRRPQGTSG